MHGPPRYAGAARSFSFPGAAHPRRPPHRPEYSPRKNDPSCADRLPRRCARGEADLVVTNTFAAPALQRLLGD